MRVHLLQRAIDKILSSQVNHPVLILATAVILAIFCAFYTAKNIGIQTSQKDLISPEEHLIKLAEQSGQFKQMDSFIVVIDGPNPFRALDFLNALTPVLESDQENFQNIFYCVDPDVFKPWALLYLNQEDIVKVTENIEGNIGFIRQISDNPTLVGFFDLLNQEMASRMVGELFTGFLDGAPQAPNLKGDLDFLVLALKEMLRFLEGEERYISPWSTFLSTKSFDIDPTEGYFWTKNKRYLLLFVTPTTRSEFSGTWHSLTSLRKAISELHNRFPDVSAAVTGPEALNADQMRTAKDDMETATLISIFGLSVLFIYFRRGIRIPLLEMSVLIIGLSWSFGITTLLIGHLNILSITFAPLLLGLGIDFGAHWFARMREEELLQPGMKKEIILSTLKRIGPAIVLAGISLTLSFLPLALTGFKGLVELGLICTFGMIVMLLASLIVLPSLVQLFGSRDSVYFLKSPIAPQEAPVRAFFKMTRKRTAFILILSTAGLAAATWGAQGVHFDLNMLNLQASNVESVIWEKKLLEGSETSSIYGEILAPDLGEVRKQTKELEELSTVSRVESIETLLPRNQERKIAVLRKIKPVMDSLKPIRPSSKPVDLAQLNDVLSRIKFKMKPGAASESGSEKIANQMAEVRNIIDRLQSVFDSPFRDREIRVLGKFERAFFSDLNSKLSILQANVQSGPMRIEDLPRALRDRFITAGHMYIIRVYPKKNIWQPKALGQFVKDIKKISPDAIGDPVTLFVFTQEFRDSCVKASVYAVILIFLFVLIVFRNLKLTLLALVPLLVGTIWTLGLMSLLGVDLNLANTLFLPLIVGAGVEYGIIILSRWRQNNCSREMLMPDSTAKGVILAGLSTTVGFGSLMISSHHGIFSLGLLAAIGSISVLLASVIFLPAFMYLLDLPRRVEKSADEGCSKKS